MFVAWVKQGKLSIRIDRTYPLARPRRRIPHSNSGRSAAECCFFRSATTHDPAQRMSLSISRRFGVLLRLIRGMGLWSATALNMIDMIGVGPFITMPLVVSAMGGPQAMLGWIAGALLAVCDGLVSAELGAALPGSGGSYRYLSEIYGPQKWGRLISFLFIWQLSFQRSALDCHADASGWQAMRPITGRAWKRSMPHTLRLCTFRGRITSGELDRDAGNCACGRHLFFHGLAALPAHHGDRAPVENIVAGRDGNDWMDHLRRADAFQRRSRV